MRHCSQATAGYFAKGVLGLGGVAKGVFPSHSLELHLNVNCEPDEFEVEVLRPIPNSNHDFAPSPPLAA